MGSAVCQGAVTCYEADVVSVRSSQREVRERLHTAMSVRGVHECSERCVSTPGGAAHNYLQAQHDVSMSRCSPY